MKGHPVIAYTFPPNTPEQTVGPLTQYVVGFFPEATPEGNFENLYVSKHIDKALTATPNAIVRAALVAERVGGKTETILV